MKRVMISILTIVLLVRSVVLGFDFLAPATGPERRRGHATGQEAHRGRCRHVQYGQCQGHGRVLHG